MDRKRASSSIVNSASNAMTVGAVNRSESDPNNKDTSPFAYDQERERFLTDLRRFHDGRGTSFARLPYVGGRSLDLFSLYNVVTRLGGWEKVSNEDLWPEVQEQLEIPRSCSNADYGLRQLYIRYLHHYEKINHFGQDPDSRDDGVEIEDTTSGRRKCAFSTHGVSFSYNYQQHNLSDNARDMLGMSSRDMLQASEYSHLERSFLSGLPNEIDFAMNVALLLSHDGRAVLSGGKGQKIVDCMLSCVGLFKDGIVAIKSLSENGVVPKFLRFWNESVEDHGVKELACPESLLMKKDTSEHNCDDEQSWSVDSYWASTLGRSLGIQDIEGQRVIQLVMIVRNLSFEEENLELLSTNLLLIRFLMLCVHNKYGCIRQLALETLSNLACKMVLEPTDCQIMQLVVRTVKRFITSSDRLEILTALETLSRLCQVDINEEVLCSQLDETVYDQIVTMLTLHDIPLLVAVLEALYQLSELGPVTTMQIARTTTAISVLIGLLTLEIQSYGPESLAGSKVVEFLHVSALSNAASSLPFAGPNTVGPPASGPLMGPAPGQPMGPPARPPPLPVIGGIRPPQAGTEAQMVAPSMPPSGVFALPRTPGMGVTLPPQISVSGFPQRAMVTTSVTGTPSAGGVDSEAVACKWLPTQYEFRADLGTGVTRMEMYRRYIASCSACGLQNVLNPVSFAACIRIVFPVAEMEAVCKDGVSDVCYKGIIPRQIPQIVAVNADRGQVMTAGPPVMLRTPIQCVRQQLMMPPVDQQNSLSSSFSSIHQALIGNMRPNIEVPPQPPGAPTSAIVSAQTTSLQMQPHGDQQQLATVQETGNALAKNGSAVETVQVMHDAKETPSSTSAIERETASTVSDTLDQNPGAQSAETNAESEPRNDLPLNALIAKTDVAEDGTSQSKVTLIQETVDAVNGLLNDVSPEVNDTLTNKVSDADVTLASNDVQKCVNGNGRVVSSKSDTFCSETSVTLSNGESKYSSSVSGIADSNGAIDAPANSNKELIAPIMVNGHKSILPNGNCSPVPSCNSDDPDSACDVKCPVSDRDSETFLTNGVLEHDDDDDDDNNDVGPMDCDDVLCKAMIRADIIDEGGRPAAIHGGDRDDDSEMSTDFISGFLGSSTGEAAGSRDAARFDEEAASAVAGLLNENLVSDTAAGNDSSKTVPPTRLAENEVPAQEYKIADAGSTSGGMPALPESASRPRVSLPVNVQVPVTCLQTNAVQHALPANSSQVPQTHFVIARAPFPFAMPGAVAAVPNQAAGCVMQQDKTVGPQVAVASGQLPNGSPSMGDATVPCPAEASTAAVPPPAPLPNGLMFSPQCSIALPSGQVVPAGVRLLIRPSGSTAGPYISGAPPVSVVSWSHPGLPATSQSSLGNNSSVAAVGQPGMPLIAAGTLQSSTGVPPVVPPPSSGQSVQLVSTASGTNTQNQLILQHAQLLAPSTAPPMFQRVLLPRPIAVARPESQVIIQQQQQQTCQSAGIRPLITTQAALGQLRLAAVAPGHSSVQVSANQQGVAGGQPLLLNHQMLNMQGQRPASSPNPSAPGTNDGQPTLGLDDQSASNQTPYLVRSQQPGQAVHALFSPQHPVRLLGNTVQLRSGLVQAGTSGSNPVIIQHGGRQIVLQPPVAATNQQPPGYVMFRPGTPALIAPRPVSASEPGKDSLDTDASTNQMHIGSSATVTSVGSPFDSSNSSSRKRPCASSVGARSLRKRKKGEEDDVEANDMPTLPVVGYVPQSTTLMFMCEWSGCQKCFETFKQICKHVTKEHFESNSAATQICQWSGCDRLPRQRWSFMTHLQDRHLNENVLRQAAEQRRRQQQLPEAQQSTAAAAPPPVYPPNAALQAIRRFSARPPFPEMMDAPEGPVTKHVRLTAALILRNLARYSSLGRSILKRHEQMLSYLACSNVESSMAISHCLYELHKH